MFALYEPTPSAVMKFMVNDKFSPLSSVAEDCESVKRVLSTVILLTFKISVPLFPILNSLEPP